MSMFKRGGRTVYEAGTIDRVEGSFPSHTLANLPVSRREQIPVRTSDRKTKVRPRLRGRR